MSEFNPEEKETPVSKIAHPDFQPRRRTPWGTVDGRVISFVSRKGGVGKTTSAVNLGAALALTGQTVLVVGTDPQCGVCRSLGTPPHELTTCLDEIHTSNQALTDMVHPSPLKGLFFISPRILSLEEEESFLRALERDPDTFIREIDRARHLYDTILIDCPPGMGSATRAALLASDSYLVPLQAEELCRDSVDSLLEFVDSFRDRVYPNDDRAPGEPFGGPFPGSDLSRPLALEGIFLTMASTHTRMGRHVAARVSEDFGNFMLETSVPRTTRLSEMSLRGKPAVIYDRRSPGSRAYFNLADELLHRYCQSEDTMGLVEGYSIPDRVDPLAPETDPETADSTESPILKAAADDGLERFLTDLGTASREARSLPSGMEPPTPEIVSLDDLLAEEEDRGQQGHADESWDDGVWNSESDGGERIN
jgi:chromosome partitioning protein